MIKTIVCFLVALTITYVSANVDAAQRAYSRAMAEMWIEGARVKPRSNARLSALSLDRASNERSVRKGLSEFAPVKFTMALSIEEEKRILLEETVLDRADPKSARYAEWLTREQVLDLMAPPAEVSDRVEQFVRDTCAAVDLKMVRNDRDAIVVESTARCAMALFNISMSEWFHKPTETYSVLLSSDSARPALPKGVEILTGLAALPYARRTGVKNAGLVNKDEKAQGYGYIAAKTIRSLYGVPEKLYVTHPNNTISAMEFLPVGQPLPQNVKGYCTLNDVPYTPISKSIGPVRPGQNTGESLLDVSLIAGLAVHATQYYITIQNAWIYEMAHQLATMDTPPLVTSVSYGWMEAMTCDSVTQAHCNGKTAAQYIARADVELAKVAAMGLTVVVCSQDEGAPSDENSACQNTEKPIWAIYPGSSAWVVSVSSTTVQPKSQQHSEAAVGAEPPICQRNYQCATGNNEVVTMANNTLYVWTTGGGFSESVPSPKWQKDAVSDWFAKAANIPPSQYANEKRRAYPDIATVGSRILLVSGMDVTVSAGTSASTPIFAAFVTLLNDARMNAKKAQLGFLSPLLAQMAKDKPSAFRAVTEGTNAWSRLQSHPCQYGYEALPGGGYNPSTGFGTPQWGPMKEYVLSLK